MSPDFGRHIALLADATRCPDCAIALPATPAECPACGLPLRGPLADQLWRASVAASGMLEERVRLIARLRASARVAEPAAAGDRRARPPLAHPHLGVPAGPTGGLPVGQAGHLPPPRSRADATWLSGAHADATADPVHPRQAQRVLLSLGVLLLGIAAIIFTVVAWGRLGIGGRSAILAGITVAAAAASVGARRRELPGTAESLALLTTGFLLLDAYGARSADLFGLRGTADDAYWAAVPAALAALGAGLWRAHPLHTVRLATVVAAQLPLLVVADRLPEPTFAALLCAQGAAALIAARRLPGVLRLARAVALGGGALGYLGGAVSAAVLAYGHSAYDGAADGSSALFPAVCALGVAALAAAAAARAIDEPVVRSLAAGAVTAAALVAAHAPMTRAWYDERPVTGGAALLLAAVALIALTPLATKTWRAGSLAVVGAGGLVVSAAAGGQLADITSGALSWLEDPWSARTAGASARDLLDHPWAASGLLPGTLALLTAGAALAAWRWRSGLAATAAGALGLATAIALPVAAGAPYLLTVLLYVAGGGALLAVAARLYGRTVQAIRAREDEAHADAAGGRAFWSYGAERADGNVLTACGLAVAGAAAAGLGLAWSLASDTATAWALAVALAAAAAAHAADPREDRPAPVAAGALLLTAEACVLTLLAGAGAAVTGFVGVVTGAVLVVVAGRAPWRSARAGERVALEAAGTCAALLAFAPTTDDAVWASNALLAAGTAAALVALLPDRRPVAWASGILVTASSWVRLAEAHVQTPEAYTTGPALALLAAGWWTRRGTDRSSWAAYAPGLTMGLLPSLARVAIDAGHDGGLPDHGLARALLLGAVALAVLLAGLRTKLAAPLLLGAAVLAADAVILLAPYAGAVPRWVSIGAAGVLLLALGATYERRLRELRRLKDRVEALG